MKSLTQPSSRVIVLALSAALAAGPACWAGGPPMGAASQTVPPTGPAVSHQGLGNSGTRQNGQQQTQTMTGPTGGGGGPHFQNGGLGAHSEGDDDTATGNYTQGNSCPGYDDSGDWQEDKGSGAKQALGSTWGAVTNAIGPDDKNEPERATSGVRGDAPGDDPSFGGYGSGGRSGTGSKATANLKPRGGDTGAGPGSSGAGSSFASPRVGSDASYSRNGGEKLNCSKIDHAGGARDPTRGGQNGIVPTH